MEVMWSIHFSHMLLQRKIDNWKLWEKYKKCHRSIKDLELNQRYIQTWHNMVAYVWELMYFYLQSNSTKWPTSLGCLSSHKHLHIKQIKRLFDNQFFMLTK